MASDPFVDGLPTLEAERLRLRQPTEADLPAFLRVFGSREDLSYWSHGPLTNDAAAREYLQGIQGGLADRTFFQWAVADRETDAMVGTCTLGSWDRSNRHADIGFILAREHWGRGLATEAVRRVLAFGFGPMNLHRVEADVHPDNDASLALLHKVGFQQEGYFRERWCTFEEWEDSVMLGLLVTDFAL